MFPVKYTTATIVVFSLYLIALHSAEHKCGKFVFPKQNLFAATGQKLNIKIKIGVAT
jgi:hypothetical protein